MAVGVLHLGRAESVTRADRLDLPEQHLGQAVPGHLGELVNRGHEHGWQKAVDLFVDYDHGQALTRGLALAEWTLTQRIAAVDDRSSAAACRCFHADVASRVDWRAAPWTVRELRRRSGAAGTRRPELPTRLPHCFGALLCRVRPAALPDPETDAARPLPQLYLPTRPHLPPHP